MRLPHAKLNLAAYGGQRLTSVTKQKGLTGRRTGAARDVILAILARNADNAGVMPSSVARPAPALYYTLTRDELTALAKGNVKQIERWVGRLDEDRARWLWRRLGEGPWPGEPRVCARR